MRRAANSIVHNIAEGFGRYEPRDKTRFYKISRGSCYEVMSQLLVSFELKYMGSKTDLDKLIERDLNINIGIVKSEQLVINSEKRVLVQKLKNKKNTESENIVNAKVVVRNAKAGEKLTTLDGNVHELDNEILVIADSESAIAIGGVMGGADTEIDDSTKRVLIESANFSLYNIRRTSMKLGIFTEAVTRFTKNQDPRQCEPVLYKAVQMIEELCNGEINIWKTSFF